ncbi:chorismate synthase [Clostridium magnum]|uniref:Chorismate synthase n=1 Tax=Clostridium magnum DSM 2767 TaxID=1121326 RepID=A0A162R3M0_9CLOT|nr:chorismate synthase [Clostridium magnum]KZL89371.1 chorismate synthase [Clostridium magnum DSM 2767]SHI20936.1 chorismate synthase [Clostridium magnum DSM 2767]
MSGVWGNKIKLSIFGESHGKAIGINIDGLEPGIELDLDYINKEMERRAPGKNKLGTPRKEEDSFQILSGYFNGRTTGTPLCAIIHNTNQHSKDYEKTKNLMRPSHGDFTGYVKYNGFNDYRGGGHFSGRITAPLVFAGAVCKQILESKGIVIGSHVKSIEKLEDKSFNMVEIDGEKLKALRENSFPVLDESIGLKMQETIIRAREERDSVGGVIETAVINLPVGVGDPYFDSVESTLAQLLFSVPGVKGVEFGVGFDISKMKGSEANDEYYIDGDKIKTYSNNNGGILGGITNGMPLVFKVAMKPTPSISKTQRTVDIEKKENAEIEIQGRHDPCIVPRALPVVEAVTAIAILDLLQ